MGAGIDPAKWGGASPLWFDVLERHSAQHLHCMMAGGDQARAAGCLQPLRRAAAPCLAACKPQAAFVSKGSPPGGRPPACAHRQQACEPLRAPCLAVLKLQVACMPRPALCMCSLAVCPCADLQRQLLHRAGGGQVAGHQGPRHALQGARAGVRPAVLAGAESAQLARSLRACLLCCKAEQEGALRQVLSPSDTCGPCTEVALCLQYPFNREMDYEVPPCTTPSPPALLAASGPALLHCTRPARRQQPPRMRCTGCESRLSRMPGLQPIRSVWGRVLTRLLCRSASTSSTCTRATLPRLGWRRPLPASLR